MSALQEIISLVRGPDPYRSAPANLPELQLEAVRERFAQQRQRIRILDRRAKDTGVERIDSLDDVVPLLFNHTNYKSYPEAFIDNGQWANMNLWLQTLTSEPVTGVNVERIRDADDWIARLAEAGHHLFASSGTSGKCSFLDQTAADVELAAAAYQAGFEAQVTTYKPANDRPIFKLFPAKGVHRLCGPATQFAERVAAQGEAHYLSDEPLLATPGIEAGRLRRALAAGTAGPGEIAAFEAKTAARQTRMAEAMIGLIDKLYDRRHDPLVLSVMWPAAFQVMEALRARGVKDGEFHPDTVLLMGGGVKGVKLPDDYREQIHRFFGISPRNYSNSYAMVEVAGLAPFQHDLNAYALPPWQVPLVLDKAGEKLLNPTDRKGKVEGRMALFDLLTEARWGGIISGDKVVVDFDKADGLSGPLVRSVARYAELEEGEDKLTCAGTIDSYVRGAIAA